MSQDASPTSLEDAPKLQNARVGIGGVQESGVKIGRRNSTGLGCTERAGGAVRVGSTARVVSGARAGKGPRAVGGIRPWARSGRDAQQVRDVETRSLVIPTYKEGTQPVP